MKSDLDAFGSFLHEPAVSEQSLADAVEQLAFDMQPDASTTIRRSFLLQTENLADITLRRTKKELEAALENQIGTRIAIQFSFNPTWGTIHPIVLDIALPGSETVVARLEYDSEDVTYTARILDTSTESEFPRSDVQCATVEALIDTLGLRTHVATPGDTSIGEVYSTLRNDIKLNETFEFAHVQRLKEVEIDDDISGIVEMRYGVVVGPEEIRFMTVLSEQTFLPASSHARITTVTQTEHGKDIHVIEKHLDGLSGESTQKNVALDYSTIEKLLENYKNLDK